MAQSIDLWGGSLLNQIHSKLISEAEATHIGAKGSTGVKTPPSTINMGWDAVILAIYTTLEAAAICYQWRSKNESRMFDEDRSF